MSDDNATPAVTTAPGYRQRMVILAICSLSLFIVSLDATIVNVALPSIQDDFHASVSGLQWTVDAYTLIVASLLLLSGSTGDRIGRRRILQSGLVLFTVASLLCSVAPNLNTLIAFRGLQAIGGSMLNPNALSIITNVFTDPKERARAIGFWGAIFGISAACGPLLGGVLVDSIGWRSIFWVNLPIGIATFVLAAKYLPESRAARPRRVDPPGQLLTIVILASLTYAIIEGPDRGWSSPLIVGLFALAAGLLAVFVTVERRRFQPLLDLRFFRSPPFAGAASIATLAFMVLAGFLFLNTLYLQQVRGDSPAMAGIATLPATVVVLLSSPLSGRLVARRGTRLPMSVAGLLLAAGCALLALGVAPHTPYGYLAVAYGLIGLGFGLVNPPITNTAVAGMPRSQAGVASAVTSTARQVGNAIGVAVIGSVVTTRYRADLAVGRAAHSAFAAASHAGWWLAAGCGLGVTVVALATTGTRGQAAAARSAATIEAEDRAAALPPIREPATHS